MNENSIREHRIRCGLSQQELADKLYVSRELVSKWETLSRRPGRNELFMLSELFGVPSEEIVVRDREILSELRECILPESSIDGSELEKLINRFVVSLKSRERCVFISRYYELKSVEEICREYGLSKNNLRVILYRTREKLKKYMEENSNDGT